MGKHWTILLAAGLLSSSLSAGETAAVKIENAWIRALPPAQKVTAAYLRVSNPGPMAVTITGGEADLAAEVQIHTTREIDGYTRMERVQQLELPAGGSAELEPGGTHLMLMQLQRMPAVGEQLNICLTLSTGEAVCAEATVKKSAATGGHDKHHQHH